MKPDAIQWFVCPGCHGALRLNVGRREDGEINVPLREGLIAEEDVAGEIGKVVCGELEGRQSDEQITVFDSTGIALQDSATVPLEYERAVAAGVGVEKKMIST